MKSFRWLAVMAALIVVAPTLAEARAGAGTSSGSRGSKTDQAPAPTQTAPEARPVERSKTPPQPQQAQKPGGAAPAAAPAAGGFMSRNPFLSGLMGGMLGAGLFGMLFGGGFSGGLGGAAGMLGLLLQVALIGGLVYLGVRLFRGMGAAKPQPAGATAGAGYARAADMPSRSVDAPLARQGVSAVVGSGTLAGGSALAGRAAMAPLTITPDDYNAFESLLSGIQTAYSKGDLAKLRTLATPEMVGYFSEELSANASRGVENKVEAVKLEQGDLSEAWREAGLEYATVAMRFSMIDTTRNVADGTIVAGNDKVRTEATEVWTFLRSPGGNWLLSAIQQT
ncbi:MAG: TIM44-like domain-containing protein [Reyranellaceae bacterium]